MVGDFMTFRKFIRIVVLISAYFWLSVGVLFGVIVVTGGFAAISIVIDMFLPQFMWISFIYLLLMLLVVRLKWNQKKGLVIALILGVTAFSLNMLPLFGVHSTVQSAETQFATTFGPNWNDGIPSDVKAKFRSTPFSLWDSFNGMTPAQCNVTHNIEYRLVNGNDSLRFDVYSPLSGSGPFPAIICIHGGGWTSGNKGVGNSFQMSRHLASQGYVVFDIIYGLRDSGLSNILELQRYLGRISVNYNNSYTIPQMIENIGNFTHYLADHANEYKVNLSSVFIIGRSAGAHLAGCVALGYNNSPYRSVFNQSITVRGSVLFYPPTNMTTMLHNAMLITAPYHHIFNFSELFEELLEYNQSKYNEYSPITYVDADSPPVLILHGTHDRLVPISESQNLRTEMNKAGRDCILIEMAFMGHAFDIIPGNPYSQISFYYIERFLALTA